MKLEINLSQLTDEQAKLVENQADRAHLNTLASLEMGYSYLNKVLQFYGVQSIEAIFVEGTSFPEQASSKKENAIAHAKEVAKRF